MKTEEFDIVIVGTGAAGLFSALSLPSHLNILMITKDKLENSDSYLAQGGICTLKTPEDYESYFEDTMKAGRYENNKESVRIMIKSSPEIIKELIRFGVNFDYNENGELSYTREGAHSTYRILHHKDITGKEITQTLINQVKQRKNIIIREYVTMIDLLENDNICRGIVAENKQGELTAINCKAVILATGGLGGLFVHSTNFRHITGDSFSIALQHNIALENINYIQIHPTTLYSKKEGRRFLISESVRGEGAVLLNLNRERFVDELLPRDVVTASIKEEMKKFHSDYVYLSFHSMPEEQIKERFPNIYSKCLEEGYNLATELVPVTPAQHYLMGGIKADINGATSMKRLYAVGETACNGVHGANRLASNSLLESLVFAKRASAQIAECAGNITMEAISPEDKKYQDKEQRQAANKKRIMDEIRRRDREFYDKWCDNED